MRSRPLLLPLTPVYRLGLALREMRLRSGLEPVRRLQWPVISVGSISAGGAGKTPLTIALARALTRRGVHVDVLSRGYGRAGRGAVRVDSEGQAEEFGDEPLVIAREAGAPVFVARERYEAGRMGEQDAAGAGVHLLDDGFQHRQLARDVDILLLSRRDWKDWLLPAGNLREPLRAAHRAHAMAISADEAEVEGELRQWGWRGPVWRLRRRMEVPPIAGPVVAFCGIARPEQFFAGLETAGLHLASRVAFADHHRYTRHDLDCLLDAARTVRATAFVTTEKDRARLGKFVAAFTDPFALETAKLRMEIESEDRVVNWLIERASSAPSHL